MGNPSPYPYLHRVVLQLDLSFIINYFIYEKTYKSESSVSFIYIIHIILYLYFLPAKFGLMATNSRARWYSYCATGASSSGWRCRPIRGEDWGHVTTCRAVIGHLEVDGGVGHVPAAGRGAPSRGQQGVGGGVHLARAGQPQLGNTVSDVS